MKLSLIVLNHNSEFGLEQSVASLIESAQGVDYEIVVIKELSGNQNTSATAWSLRKVRFALVEKDANVAAAVNSALALCTGEYILLVTPDTKCHRDSLRKMIAFMDNHPKAGGLTVRLVNAEGRFLPDAVRGLNKSWSAFFRLAGFARNLTKSRLYDHRMKDWADEFRVMEIDILNNSCMFLRRSALAETGFFDERFVQYGNIDLSYRLRLAGYKNFYFPKTYFIQNSLRNTPERRLQLMWQFSAAMLIFVLKYFIRLPRMRAVQLPRMQHSHFGMEG